MLYTVAESLARQSLVRACACFEIFSFKLYICDMRSKIDNGNPVHEWCISFHSQWSWREQHWSSQEWRGHVILAPKHCPGNKKHTQGSRNSIVMSPCGDYHLAWLRKGRGQQIDWFVTRMYKGCKTPLWSSILAFHLLCQPLLFLCVCHLHMADQNLTSVGGRLCPQESVSCKC